MTTVKDRFEQKFIPEPNSGCWLWMEGVDKDGYGQFHGNGKNNRAHRVSYELYVAPIPSGLQVLHKCDTPNCCNPDHLFLGTNMDNVEDKVQKNRQACHLETSNPSCKLTEDEVIGIRADTRTQAEIAADYGIKREAVSKIKLRKRWAHI